MRHLYLMRHAKSLWNNPASTDFGRHLSPRGLRDAKNMASYMKKADLPIEMVLCSSAKRTTQTLEPIRAILKKSAQVKVEDALYRADSSEVLNRLVDVPAAINSVLIIGHNPTIQILAHTMAPAGPLKEQLALKFPTAALAIIDLENDSWDLSDPNASGAKFVRPSDVDQEEFLII
ncbi:MAG: histidine phosphatase family protein [Actinomycetota bacterium]|nr:MAG: histidine phosphatase family protein [Actinomycetota bacterium]